ncbi:MAG: hypothetical protein ACI9K2_007500 [Myxococcota bacterium]|jgi:hypothetical protein
MHRPVVLNCLYSNEKGVAMRALATIALASAFWACHRPPATLIQAQLLAPRPIVNGAGSEWAVASGGRGVVVVADDRASASWLPEGWAAVDARSACGDAFVLGISRSKGVRLFRTTDVTATVVAEWPHANWGDTALGVADDRAWVLDSSDGTLRRFGCDAGVEMEIAVDQEECGAGDAKAAGSTAIQPVLAYARLSGGQLHWATTPGSDGVVLHSLHLDRSPQMARCTVLPDARGGFPILDFDPLGRWLTTLEGRGFLTTTDGAGRRIGDTQVSGRGYGQVSVDAVARFAGAGSDLCVETAWQLPRLVDVHWLDTWLGRYVWAHERDGHLRVVSSDAAAGLVLRGFPTADEALMLGSEPGEFERRPIAPARRIPNPSKAWPTCEHTM